MRAQMDGDVARSQGLHLTQIGRRVVVVLRPDELAGVYVYQLRGDSNEVPAHLDGSLHQDVQSQQACHQSRGYSQAHVPPHRAGGHHLHSR